MILQRTESKDILDSGSKSQRANEEQREIFRREESKRRGCVDGPAGSYVNKELVSAMEFAAASWLREGHFF